MVLKVNVSADLIDGDVDEGIKFVRYDDDEKSDGDELTAGDTDDELGADI